MNFLGDIYIHISQCARSDHISKKQDFKVLEGRGRKTNGQWLICAAKSELWVHHHLTPNLKLSQCSSGKNFVIIMRVTEKEMATQSSILAWRNPWTEKPGRLWSVGSQNKGWDTTEQLSFIWELSMIWKDKHLANWWGNLSIHLLNG